MDGGPSGVATQEWKGVCVHKYGWSLTLKLKKRTIVYLGPCAGCFRVAFTLSDKAVEAARMAKLPRKIQQALAEAPRDPEGTGLWLEVNKAADLAAIRKLAEIKLAHGRCAGFSLSLILFSGCFVLIDSQDEISTFPSRTGGGTL